MWRSRRELDFQVTRHLYISRQTVRMSGVSRCRQRHSRTLDQNINTNRVEGPLRGISPRHASREGPRLGYGDLVNLGEIRRHEGPSERPTDLRGGEHAELWIALHLRSPGQWFGPDDGRPSLGVLLGGPDRTASATLRWNDPRP